MAYIVPAVPTEILLCFFNECSMNKSGKIYKDKFNDKEEKNIAFKVGRF